jgi:proteasome lid subunit RPN8/RPN11
MAGVSLMEHVSPPRKVRIVALRAILLASADRLRFTQPASPAPSAGQRGPSRTNAESGIDAVPELTWNCEEAEVRVTVSGHARDELARHCGESNVHGCEVGGILVGYRYERTPEAGGPVQHFVTLTDLIPVESCDRSEAHVCFDEDTWEDIERQMNERFTPEGKCRLGWYHTHPSQGIFFSGQDRDAHTVFQRAHQFALVIDPRVMEAGLFYWLDYDARVLAGPLRFSVASASRAESALVTADAHSDRPMRSFHPLPNLHWVRFAAFWALAGLLSGYIAGRSGERLPAPWQACVFAAILLVCLRLWNLGFFHRRLRTVRISPTDTVPDRTSGPPRIPRMVYATIPAYAAAVLAVFFAVHYAARRIPSAVRPPAVSAPPATIAVLPGPSAFTTGAAPAKVAAPNTSETIRLFVSEQTVKERHRSRKGDLLRVVVESRGSRAKVTYSVRGCNRLKAEAALASCTISDPGRSEEHFFDRVFSGRNSQGQTSSQTEFVKALQSSLGLPDPHDGEWGPRTRTAWLARALSPRVEPLRIPSFGSMTAIVIFEKE